MPALDSRNAATQNLIWKKSVSNVRNVAKRSYSKKTKKGRKYYGCENNPECDFMSWSRPVEEKCPKCGGYMVVKGSKIVCADEQCGYVTEKKEKNQE